LIQVGFYHTRGETPRHFQFDASGQYLLVANQDSNSIAVFNFNLSNGEIKYTGNEYRVPSPNFVCCVPLSDDDDSNPFTADEEAPFLPTHVADQVVGAWVDDASSEYESDKYESDNSATLSVKHDGPTKKENPLEAELARAHLEIQELKKLLQNSSMNGANVPTTN
jgi:hypothetical protein